MLNNVYTTATSNQGQIQTFATFAQANFRFYGQKLSVVNSGLHNICNVYFLIYKQYTKFYLMDSISCLFLNLWIPSAIASYPVINIVKQCSESIPLVINYKEPIISGAKFE